ncbi:MAG: hypothetical protein QOF73_3219 [Thermomicrobiales bacterium]|nr:hypothetical protein [Thermomicrobiales bacterium]
MDLAKRDLTVTRGGRTFSVRAYLDGRHPSGPGWHAVIVENRTPLRHALAPTTDPEACLAAAVRFLTATVAADADRRDEGACELEGGASAGHRHDALARHAALPRQGTRGAVGPGVTGGTFAP